MLYDLIEQMGQQIQEHLENNAQEVAAENVGLDRRCGNIWICDDCVVIPRHMKGTVEYYGGFEYIDPSYVSQVGDWVVYFTEGGDDRVQDCINRFSELQGESQ